RAEAHRRGAVRGRGPRRQGPRRGQLGQDGPALARRAGRGRDTMSKPAPEVSVFPKCYFDELYTGRMDYVGWIRQAATLGADGVAFAVEGIRRSLEYAGRRGVVLCLENHYKDGAWAWPEFAQAEDVFLEILGRLDSPQLGVQYDPSNAIVGGYDPVAFLEK